jgi:ABC-type transport system involved in cytochrome c biogenesis permease subunit
MEGIFEYRRLLEMTQVAALASSVVAIVSAISWFVLPLFKRSASALAVTPEGSQIPVSDSSKVKAPAFLLALSRLLPTLTFVCMALNIAAQTARYFEVQHWPAQTMYEVIPLGTATGFLSSLILYYVLGFHKLRGMSRGFCDLFQALIFIGCCLTLGIVLGLDPTGKALPPALQSYWFSTHITAYMFGYFTLFIATVAAWLFFCFKFWRGLFHGKAHPMSRITFWGTIAFATVSIPFGNLGIAMGPGVLLSTGVLALMGKKSQMAWFDRWEAGADRFTWLIFVVGFPFLTAGLIQGGLWAQESWAFYWGWDSKEVSALISWLFYVIYLHLRYVAGWRGEKGMWILASGGLSIYITFQLFGMLPASQSSLHRYTDMEEVPAERLMEEEG